MKITFANLFFLIFVITGCQQTEVQLIDSNLNNLVIDSRFSVEVFASDINSPRQMAEDGEGRVYVGSRRSGKIFALIDSDNNGAADEKILIADNLTFATGISFFDGDLFFSEINKIWKIKNINSYFSSDLKTLPEKILITENLPSDEWHGWKWIQHDKKGNLYTNVGAPCNICLQDDKRYATILRLNNDSWDFVARGVRNSVGFDFHPTSEKLYFTDNGRDWLGDDSPSCELNRVDVDGGFYGFPYKHATNIVDPDFGNINSGFDFIDPILELGAHVAPTGIAFYSGEMFPEEFQENLFIALHGSWNRSQKVGYKIIRVIFDEVGDVKTSEDFITGWLDSKIEKDSKVEEIVYGRPSAPFILNDGSMLISDDKANLIYRVVLK
jgi:glucose/arabinose dehydrogenase